MIVSLGLMNVFIFVIFFAPNDGTLLAGELLCGESLRTAQNNQHAFRRLTTSRNTLGRFCHVWSGLRIRGHASGSPWLSHSLH